VVRAVGGNGGDAAAGTGTNTGGSCGGGGGGGGRIQACVGQVTGPTVAGFFRASGGVAGSKSAKRGTGIDTTNSGGGLGGNITACSISRNATSKATPVAPVGIAGGVSTLDLVAP
jgi:hypothetical protein